MGAIKYLKILKDEEIARRYFIMNSFDGALTIFGILIGMYTVGVTDPKMVILPCLGVSVAMAISGIWGAYTSERAERREDIRRLEEHMLVDLSNTQVGRDAQMISILIALVNSLSPLVVSMILISPFILAQIGVVSLENAFLSSTVLAATILFLIGAFVGNISRDGILKNGFKMLLAGVIVSLIVLAIDSLSFA
ncbi:MAG: hypothetical protein JW778_00660 [Candidatus Altiarchaeota archaeon]|nr:hypothetical protein [Candidatus Altiarchaeota archaeon]